jgi:hypothetical protein
MINYNGKSFRFVSNSENGLVSGDMVFRYNQTGDMLTCNFSGEKIVFGCPLALVAADGSLYMRYHQLNSSGKLMTGKCISTPELLANGRLRLNENWAWTSGDRPTGHSVLEEIPFD